MVARRRLTLATQRVLKALLTDPSSARYGLEICYMTELPSGTVYPILARLEEDYGWIESELEDPAQQDPNRPRRRYFRFTTDGAIFARDALADAYSRAPRASKPPLFGGSQPEGGSN